MPERDFVAITKPFTILITQNSCNFSRSGDRYDIAVRALDAEAQGIVAAEKARSRPAPNARDAPKVGSPNPQLLRLQTLKDALTAGAIGSAYEVIGPAQVSYLKHLVQSRLSVR